MLQQKNGLYEDLFGYDTQYWKMRLLLGRATGDDASGFTAAEKLLDLCPGVAASWLLYIGLLVRRKRMSEVEALLERAARYYQGANVFAALLARGNLLMGRMTEAETNGREYYARASGAMNATFPLIEVFARQRRFDEIRELVTAQSARPSRERKKFAEVLKKMRLPIAGELEAILAVAHDSAVAAKPPEVDDPDLGEAELDLPEFVDPPLSASPIYQ